MSEEFESLFDTVFGKGGTFEAIFGKGGKLDEAFRRGPKVVRHVSKRSDGRARYQEALMTELLTTLAGKGLLTNAEAQDVIKKAKERVQGSTGETEGAAATERTTSRGDVPCGGSCPLHDKRPHKSLECQRCKSVQPHLIEGEVARCRTCLTPRMSS
jgi:hypothetical protein